MFHIESKVSGRQFREKTQHGFMCSFTIRGNRLQRIEDICWNDLSETPWLLDADRLGMSSTNAHQAADVTGTKQCFGFIEHCSTWVVATESAVDVGLRPPNLDVFEKSWRRRCRSSSLPNLAIRVCFARLIAPEKNRYIGVHVIGIHGANETKYQSV